VLSNVVSLGKGNKDNRVEKRTRRGRGSNGGELLCGGDVLGRQSAGGGDAVKTGWVSGGRSIEYE